jgi:hypothetical protein
MSRTTGLSALASDLLRDLETMERADTATANQLFAVRQLDRHQGDAR